MDRARLKTVLYVDDEPDIREVVELSLGLAGALRIHTCDSGLAALDNMPLIQPDLVLLDVMMPGLDGPATLQRMQNDERLAHIPVVFMTAKAMPQEVARFREMGAIAVIPKPFDPMRLSEQVYAIWEGLPRG
ncbi:MAG: response regulator [Steroidobacteraceae bacterium]